MPRLEIPITDLASLEADLEATENDIKNLRNMHDQTSKAVLELQAQQRTFSLNLQTLSEKHQRLERILNATKFDHQNQQLERLENQLLQQQPEPQNTTVASGIKSNVKPMKSLFSLKEVVSSIPSKRSHGSTEDATQDEDLPNPQKSRLESTSDPVNQQGENAIDEDAGDDAAHVKILVDGDDEDADLCLSADAPQELVDAWKQDGEELRAAWKEQLEKFRKSNPDWTIQKLVNKSCMRCSLKNQNKCYHTKTEPGKWACKTCWNTNSLCVAWDEENEVFHLLPQWPAARADGNKSPAPFDIEMFLSGNPAVLRKTMPQYWSSKLS